MAPETLGVFQTRPASTEDLENLLEDNNRLASELSYSFIGSANLVEHTTRNLRNYLRDQYRPFIAALLGIGKNAEYRTTLNHILVFSATTKTVNRAPDRSVSEERLYRPLLNIPSAAFGELAAPRNDGTEPQRKGSIIDRASLTIGRLWPKLPAKHEGTELEEHVLKVAKKAVKRELLGISGSDEGKAASVR